MIAHCFFFLDSFRARDGHHKLVSEGLEERGEEKKTRATPFATTTLTKLREWKLRKTNNERQQKQSKNGGRNNKNKNTKNKTKIDPHKKKSKRDRRHHRSFASITGDNRVGVGTDIATATFGVAARVGGASGDTRPLSAATTPVRSPVTGA